ncbi:MAG: TonB-dependent receptor [Alphaproteobacteria bacterium]|nr:TonB-dependent receptor [Alphaproteobacteria bacterium]
MFSKKFWGGVALTALSVAMNGGVAHAQSTGSQDFEDEIVVTGSRRAPTVGGVITNETAPKARASIGQEYIETQTVGQSALELVNVIPGVNFTNNDSYGSSGGNLRMRSFDGNRVSLTFDGMPLNDTGNYAIFSNQLLDSELLGAVQVNMGSTDVDSPTASATGGTINYTLRKPSDDFTWAGSLAGGENSYGRVFAGIDTGEVGPLGTSLMGAASFQEYSKWRGQGELEKKQFNGRFYQPIGEDGDFMAVAFHWNENRNNNYRAMTLADYRTFGRELDFAGTCNRPTPTAGTAQNEAASCSSDFFGRQVNPSNTGNIRGSSRFSLGDSLTLTVDPSFQYVLADGGSQLGSTSETGTLIRGTANPAGRDLNGDGDFLDTIAFFTPSVTNTRRYGVTSSLIWDIADNHRVRVAYTNDYGRHRQTGEWTPLNADGTTTNVFGGKDGQGARVFNADGYHLRTRDRFSIATLNQLAFEYRGQFLDEKLTVVAGVRAPFFSRDLNQYCYTQSNSSNVLCTSQTPTPVGATQFVTFTGSATQYIRPFKRTYEYDAVLPNIGVSYKLADDHQLFTSYIQGLSAPRTDQLYTEDLNNVQPEETQAFDVGYRYNGDLAQFSAAVFVNKYSNRIQSAFDDATGAFIDRSIGDVDVWGAEAAIGFNPFEGFNVFLTATYLQSELQSDIRNGRGVDLIFGTADDPRLPTAGKALAESPEWSLFGRTSYDIGPMRFGLEAKWVDVRWSTDVNDEKAPAYTVVDFDLNFDIEEMGGPEGVNAQININNLFDEDYLGSISSRSNRFTVVSNGSNINGSAPTYNPGAPRTLMVSLRKSF